MMILIEERDLHQDENSLDSFRANDDDTFQYNDDHDTRVLNQRENYPHLPSLLSFCYLWQSRRNNNFNVAQVA